MTVELILFPLIVLTAITITMLWYIVLSAVVKTKAVVVCYVGSKLSIAVLTKLGCFTLVACNGGQKDLSFMGN